MEDVKKTRNHSFVVQFELDRVRVSLVVGAAEVKPFFGPPVDTVSTTYGLTSLLVFLLPPSNAAIPALLVAGLFGPTPGA